MKWFSLKALSAMVSLALLVSFTAPCYAAGTQTVILPPDDDVYNLLVTGLEAGEAISDLESLLGNEIAFDPKDYNAEDYSQDWTADAMSFVTDTLAASAVPFAEEPSQETQAKASSIAYAMKCAQWSVNKGRGTDFGDESVYMFFSHYIDRNEYFWAASNPQYLMDGPQMSENSQYFAKWITNDDRLAYDFYMNKSGVFSAAQSICDIALSLSSIISSGGSLANITSDIEMVKKSFSSTGIFLTGLDAKLAGVDVFNDLTNIVTNIRTTLTTNPEEKLSLIYQQYIEDATLLQDYGTVARESLIRTSISLVGAFILGCVTGGGGIAVEAAVNSALIGMTLDTYFNLFQYASWVSMRSTFHARHAGRYGDYLKDYIYG